MSRTNLSRPGFRGTVLRRQAAALVAVIGLLLVVLLPASAQAASYRYWGYFQLSGDSWEFASKGPDQTKPADGSVEGWRFAVGSEGDTRTPRATATFEELCADTKAEEGQKRVGVVVDYGRAADHEAGTEPPEPVGHCAQVDSAATGAEVLSDVAEVRSQDSLVCAVDQVPTKGCGGEVKNVSAAAKAADAPVELQTEKASEGSSADTETEDEGSRTGTWIGIGVAVLAAVALAVTALVRRRQA
jgi:hypothetical protein